MNLVGLLSWYNEDPEWLEECIESFVEHAGITHLIAVDGAYELFPNGQPSSPPAQAHAIHRACERMGITRTIHTPPTVWKGNEVEKRNYMFRLASEYTLARCDFYIVMDADELVTSAPEDLRTRITFAREDVGVVSWTEPQLDGTSIRKDLPTLFRAQRIQVGPNHWTLTAMDTGRVLWGPRDEVRRFYTGIEILHKTNLRDKTRAAAQRWFYKVRDSQGVEKAPYVFSVDNAIPGLLSLRKPKSTPLIDRVHAYLFGYNSNNLALRASAIRGNYMRNKIIRGIFWFRSL